ncbi:MULTISPECIES: LexA family transcriptional regulator [Photorhabdus]|uniref:Helix-turn-helix domain-containing protein n=1 Tax=Photorhabdus kayaii TaxID=230088 RepID=A0ABX0B3U5_9GAMM|nr:MULTISPECIES: S24 family peptidase [Photorhabdus]MCC8375590.1 helix-turn-helix domain-containing protein [Photorhabdus bodei]MCT8354206.1 helix-turn-helix domain-containing protein [Photorhabdus kayaii]MDB6366717.1 helix-turn-helix domain-containing protein [Photorhabdus bodei]NDL14304.1 helix-turn-helix domain-containing protein [Photorhabdus kayaii]NDL27817.1 helix-turn-helix domain-containing protein [Photorhabdus kayaii]
METKDIRRMNLRTLMETRIRQGITKAYFAELIGIPASQLSQLTSGNAVRNIGDIIARRVEANLGLPVGWLDVPQHANEIDYNRDNNHNDNKQRNYHLQNLSHEDTDQSYRIEQLNVELSCGGGRLNNDYPDVIRSIEIDPEYAKGMFGTRKPSALKITTAVGDSMLGTVNPGELVVIDITVNRFVSDGIYAFTYCDALHIKRLQLLKDKLIVISDNKTYDRWEIDSSDKDLLHIQGFVVGKWKADYTRLG